MGQLVVGAVYSAIDGRSTKRLGARHTEEWRTDLEIEYLGKQTDKGAIVRMVDPLLVLFDVLPIDSQDECLGIFDAHALRESQLEFTWLAM
jgi:hypothetical protein